MTNLPTDGSMATLSRSIPLFSLMLACGAAQSVDSAGGLCGARTPVGPAAAPSALANFSYDATAPLGATADSVGQDGPITIYQLGFNSPAGGRATGLLFVPAGGGPFPGVIFQHGMPGSAFGATARSTLIARHGAVVVALDAPFARRGGSPVLFTAADSAAQVQLMQDLQRAMDLLVARPDVDPTRLGYVGVSYGGAMGALFVAIERRLKTAVLVVGDGGLVTHFTGPEDAGGPLDQLDPATRDRWLAAMTPIEPIRFVHLARPTRLLLQSGRTDQLVPPRDAMALQAAACEPKQVQWYDAGHGLTPEAVTAQLDWLHTELGTLAP